jgi:ubiquinone/menaquinone biosynthesis C-methylase UbiE
MYFTCCSCGGIYPVEEGIPLLIPGNLDISKSQEASYHTRISREYFRAHHLNTYRVRYYHNEFLAAFDSLPPGAIILEVGAGVGNDGLHLMKHGYHVVETDIAKGMLHMAYQDCLAQGLTSNATFIGADAENLPFRDIKFDAVLIVAALHHLNDPVRFLNEVSRCCIPGGLLVIGFEPNRWQYYTIYAVLRLVRNLIGSRNSVPESSTDAPRRSVADETTHGFTHRQLEHLLSDTGFEILSIKPVWYTCGFMNLLMEIYRRVLPSCSRILLPTFIERIAVAIDELIGRVRGLCYLPWHWNVVARNRPL